jgi:hypothetical protein
MAKTYNHKKRRRNSTRKSGGYIYSFKTSKLKDAMKKGRVEANKHYENSKKAYQPHADKLVSDINKQYNKQKSDINTQYNKQKYKNTSNFATAKYGEHMYNKSKTMVAPHVETIRTKFNANQALEAAARSQAGSPQADFQYGSPGVIATQSPTIYDP